MMPLQFGCFYDGRNMLVVDEKGVWLNGWNIAALGITCPCTTHTEYMHGPHDHGMPILPPLNGYTFPCEWCGWEIPEDEYRKHVATEAITNIAAHAMILARTVGLR